MHASHFFTDYQPNTGTCRFLTGVKSLEDRKDFSGIFRVNSYSIILYKKITMSIKFFTPNRTKI